MARLVRIFNVLVLISLFGLVLVGHYHPGIFRFGGEFIGILPAGFMYTHAFDRFALAYTDSSSVSWWTLVAMPRFVDQVAPPSYAQIMVPWWLLITCWVAFMYLVRWWNKPTQVGFPLAPSTPAANVINPEVSK